MSLKKSSNFDNNLIIESSSIQTHRKLNPIQDSNQKRTRAKSTPNSMYTSNHGNYQLDEFNTLADYDSDTQNNMSLGLEGNKITAVRLVKSNSNQFSVGKIFNKRTRNLNKDFSVDDQGSSSNHQHSMKLNKRDYNLETPQKFKENKEKNQLQCSLNDMKKDQFFENSKSNNNSVKLPSIHNKNDMFSIRESDCNKEEQKSDDENYDNNDKLNYIKKIKRELKNETNKENLTREKYKDNTRDSNYKESNKENLRENLREINKNNFSNNTVKFDKYSNTKIVLPNKNKKDDEDPNFNTKGFKLRYYIINGNGFHTLFRTMIILKTAEWQENFENDPIFCNYIHLQKNSEKFNIQKLPKDSDNLIEFQKEKQQQILNQIEKNSNSHNTKLQKFFQQEITTLNHCKQYYTLFSHLQNNREFCYKEKLHKNLFNYYKNNNLQLNKCTLPITQQIVPNDPCENQWDEFKEYAKSIDQKVWILKPGENSNKGCGIKVMDNINEIQNHIKNNDSKRWICQKQIEKPLLIGGRKFDIRIQGLITCLHGKMVAQFFKYCQVRTNSVEQTLDDLSDPLIHLSNDAIQGKNKELQGKFEDHNKMSINEFNRTVLFPKTNNQNQFYEKIWPKMKEEQANLMQSLKYTLDPHRRHHGFEILGFDQMLDDNLNLYLIEVNNNPALGTHGCKVLENPIFALRNDTQNLTVNKLFHNQEDQNKQNQYEIVYDDESENGIDRNKLRKMHKDS